jgi:hypothetical protein
MLVIFVPYVFLSALIGEFHPFTRVPMYSQLPNWAYVFYLTDDDGNVLYIHQYFPFTRHTGAVAHFFYSYCNEHKIPYGDRRESPEQLEEAGNAMLDFLFSVPMIKKPDTDSVHLVRKDIFYDQTSKLSEKDEIIASRKI